MKGRLGKWLAVLLSVSMLAGTAPVYGADISMESDFSSGAAETEEQPDVQEGTEITEEPGDSDVEITEEPETEQPEDAEFSEGEFNGEDQEELVMDGSDDEDSAELTFEDAPFAGENSTKEYLKDLSVYSGYGVKDPLEISRREDLDETYGGKTYTVEIGSSYNSTGFYVTADLGADAPEGQRSGYLPAILMERRLRVRSLQPDIPMENVIIFQMFLQRIMEKGLFTQ